MDGPITRISVIAPLRNERANVDSFVSDLAAQDFEGELEVLVADGASDDGGIERLRAAARDAGLHLQVIDNAAGWVSPGLNACIREARGDLIVRLDCHSRYPRDYLRRCAEVSEETGAWNVGGRLVPTGTTPIERAVACAMDSPFGGIGWTRSGGAARAETDTVTFGAFRPEVFEHVGLFDEALVRNQDDEFNMRMRARRRAASCSTPPSRWCIARAGRSAGVWRQYFEYGLWKVPVMLKHRRIATLRSSGPAGVRAWLPQVCSPGRPARGSRAACWRRSGCSTGPRRLLRRPRRAPPATSSGGCCRASSRPSPRSTWGTDRARRSGCCAPSGAVRR